MDISPSKRIRLTAFDLGAIAVFAASGAAVGALVQVLKLPVYLDMIGVFAAAVLMGPLPGILTAILGQALLTLLTSPATFAYVGTAIALALLTSLFVRWGYGRRIFPTILFGILLGIVSALLSAPVTTYLFGGISFVGADALTLFFKATGQNLATSVVLGGLTSDPVDKLAVSLILWGLLRTIPLRVLDRFTFYNRWRTKAESEKVE